MMPALDNLSARCWRPSERFFDGRCVLKKAKKQQKLFVCTTCALLGQSEGWLTKRHFKAGLFFLHGKSAEEFILRNQDDSDPRVKILVRAVAKAQQEGRAGWTGRRGYGKSVWTKLNRLLLSNGYRRLPRPYPPSYSADQARRFLKDVKDLKVVEVE